MFNIGFTLRHVETFVQKCLGKRTCWTQPETLEYAKRKRRWLCLRVKARTYLMQIFNGLTVVALQSMNEANGNQCLRVAWCQAKTLLEMGDRLVIFPKSTIGFIRITADLFVIYFNLRQA